MRASLLASALLLFVAACGDSTKPPAPAQVALTTVTTPLDAIGATATLVAVVTDESGRVMDNAAVTWTSSSPGVAVTPTPENGLSATVTAVASGDATITARAGDATASTTVSVVQQVAAITAEGSGQVGTVNAVLPNELVVRISDRRGAPIANRAITFSAAGGGMLSATSVATSADGSARVSWTLGKLMAQAQHVTATAGLFTAEFHASAMPAAPALVRKVAGDGQTWYIGTTVPVAPTVQVTDLYGNPIMGLDVTFLPVNSTVTGDVQTTSPLGTATVGAWTLGTVDGGASLIATVASAGISATFNGTAQSTSPPVTVSVAGAPVQAAVEGLPLSVLPAVRVTDAAGAPVPGRRVTFNITGGGGTSTNSVAVSGADGLATMGSWTLGSVAGPNSVTATVEGLAVTNNNPVFTAIGCTGSGSTAGYTINVCFTTPVTEPQRLAFVSAAARWGSIITGDVADLPVSLTTPNCGPAAPALHLTIDDLVIFASIQPIDGSGKILGSAGWCYRRTAGLPLIGLMRFDEADVADLVATGRFGAVILHEMGHVLGIGGSLWSAMGFLQNPSSSEAGSVPLDTHFNGVHAIAGFDQIGGTGYTGGQKVPVENAAGPGSINAHWRENVLANELMTPFLNFGSNPLTVLTVLSLRDLGYVVDPTSADQSSMSRLHAESSIPGSEIDLEGRVRDVPKYSIDRQGRTVRLQ